MSDNKFGVIQEQGFLGEGFGFTEASKEDKEKFEKESNKEDNNGARR